MSMAARRLMQAGSVQKAGSDFDYGFSIGSDFNALASSTRRTYYTDMVSMGATWVRLDASWATVQAGGATSWDWTVLDGLVADAQFAGLKVLLIPAYTPSWAGPTGSMPVYAPYNVSDYANFVSGVVSRYYPQGITAYEIWNEPNNANFWADTVANPIPNAAHYVQLLQAAYPAAKSAASGCMIITGGSAPADDSSPSYVAPRTWLQALYDNGAKGYFDAVGHHPYSYPTVPSDYEQWSAWSQMDQTSPSLRSIMEAEGDGAKLIWMTETGEPTSGSGSVSEAIQSQNNTEAVTLDKSYAWAGPVFLWTYIDRQPYGATTDVGAYWGIYKSDHTPKPAVAALRNL